QERDGEEAGQRAGGEPAEKQRHEGEADADEPCPARPHMIGERTHHDAEERAAKERRGDQQALLGRAEAEVLGDEVCERPEQVPDAEAQVEVDERREERWPVAYLCELRELHAGVTGTAASPRRGGPKRTRPVRASKAAWWQGHSKRPRSAGHRTGHPRCGQRRSYATPASASTRPARTSPGAGGTA